MEKASEKTVCKQQILVLISLQHSGMACSENSYDTFPEGPLGALVSGEGWNCARWVRGCSSVCHSCSEVDKPIFGMNLHCFSWSKGWHSRRMPPGQICQLQMTNWTCCHACCSYQIICNFQPITISLRQTSEILFKMHSSNFFLCKLITKRTKRKALKYVYWSHFDPE